MYQYGPKLPPPLTPPYIRQFIGCSVSLPLTLGDIYNPNNPASSANAGNPAFIANLNHSADFGIANPRNPNSPNYGTFPGFAACGPDGVPMYNIYLH